MNSHNSDRSRKRRRVSPFADDGIGFGDRDDSDLDGKFQLIHKKAHKQTQTMRRRCVFPWEKLPGELCNVVYEFALISENPIELSITNLGKPRVKITPESKEWGDYNIAPSLILINKAAYTEASHLLYRNKFRFANAKTMYYFIMTIPPKMKGMIERIELANERLPGWAHLYSQRNHDPRYMALAFPSLIGMNLKSLELAKGFDMDDWACAYSLANFLSRNGFGHWLRWIAQEKGDPKAARDILNLREDGALRWLGRMVAYRGGVSLKYIVSRHSGAGSLAPASETEQEEIWESFKRFLGA